MEVFIENFPEIINNNPSKWIQGHITFNYEFPVKLKKFLFYKIGNGYSCNLKFLEKEYAIDNNDIEVELNEEEFYKSKKWEFQIQIVPKLPIKTYLHFIVETVF
jgi:hypothetical protein